MQLHPWHLQELFDENQQLKAELKKERRKFKVSFKGFAIIFLLWLIVGPLLWAVLVNSLIPNPIRNTLIAVSNFTNDAAFGMQCKFREMQRK